MKIRKLHKILMKVDKIIPKILDKNILDAIEKFDHLKSPAYDPENVHRFRISIRKIKSLLSFFKPLFDPAWYLITRDKLRVIQQDTSALRETDVMLGQILNTFKSITAYEEPGKCLFDLVTRFNIAERHRIQKIIQAEGWKTDLVSIHSSLLANEIFLSECCKVSFDVYANERITGWIKKTARLHKNVDFQDHFAVHDLRIRYKKIRYCTEEMQGVLKFDYESLLKIMKPLQENAGYLHDAVLNDLLISKILRNSHQRKAYFEAGYFSGRTNSQIESKERNMRTLWKKFKKIKT